MMQVHTTWHDIEPEARGASCAMGNFDGVHLGHQAVLDMARGAAPLGVITFAPHPRRFFAPQETSFQLMSPQTRAAVLADLGVAQLFELPFDAALAALSAEAFIRDVLGRGLGISRLVVGEDFRFGKGRAGSAQDLHRLGPHYGFETLIAQTHKKDGAALSSTAIRRALSEGHPREAAAILGRPYSISGEVIHGEKRGRTLGYPTANIALGDLHLPRLGVYAVLFDVKSGSHKGRYLGAANLGTRPMFGENLPNLETYVFDFEGDLYGAEVCVSLIEYLRPEVHFDGLEPLIAQMSKDCADARAVLAAYDGARP